MLHSIQLEMSEKMKNVWNFRDVIDKKLVYKTFVYKYDREKGWNQIDYLDDDRDMIIETYSYKDYVFELFELVLKVISDENKTNHFFKHLKNELFKSLYFNKHHNRTDKEKRELYNLSMFIVLKTIYLNPRKTKKHKEHNRNVFVKCLNDIEMKNLKNLSDIEKDSNIIGFIEEKCIEFLNNELDCGFYHSSNPKGCLLNYRMQVYITSYEK